MQSFRAKFRAQTAGSNLINFKEIWKICSFVSVFQKSWDNSYCSQPETYLLLAYDITVYLCIEFLSYFLLIKQSSNRNWTATKAFNTQAGSSDVSINFPGCCRALQMSNSVQDTFRVVGFTNQILQGIWVSTNLKWPAFGPSKILRGSLSMNLAWFQHLFVDEEVKGHQLYCHSQKDKNTELRMKVDLAPFTISVTDLTVIPQATETDEPLKIIVP